MQLLEQREGDPVGAVLGESQVPEGSWESFGVNRTLLHVAMWILSASSQRIDV